MAKSAFLSTTILFQSGGELYEVTTDGDYVYIENKKMGGETIEIDIDDWFDIITYIEKQLK
jgi:hypothetical protein